MEKEQLLKVLSSIAKIKILDHEKDIYTHKLSQFIEWTNKIKNIDTNNVEPMFNVLEVLGNYNANIRNDEVSVLNNKDVLLNNSPDREDDFIVVPKIIE